MVWLKILKATVSIYHVPPSFVCNLSVKMAEDVLSTEVMDAFEDGILWK